MGTLHGAVRCALRFVTVPNRVWLLPSAADGGFSEFSTFVSAGTVRV
jgi:hypothetical protein